MQSALNASFLKNVSHPEKNTIKPFLKNVGLAMHRTVHNVLKNSFDKCLRFLDNLFKV